ncbi:MAG: tRNA lysidine(34) synthetase TilS [Sphingomonadales bacterium]
MTKSRPGAAPISQPEFDALMDAFPRLADAPSVAVAVSGGPDSMALALLAGGWAAARGVALTALTVDHGLRAGSAAEARAVAGWMAARGIEHHVLAWSGAPRGNVQAEARRARYGLLENWCAARGIPALLLAHHLEDQAETVLLRLGRGSGVYGLAGMAGEAAPAWPGAPVRIRPLLGVPRQRLAATLRAAGQDWVEDPSNHDPAFARVRVRSVWSKLAPLGITPERLAGTARRMARARAALDAEAQALIAVSSSFGDGGWCSLNPEPLRAAHEEVALRTLAMVLMAVGGGAYPPRLERLERLWARLRDGEPGAATLAGCRTIPAEGAWLIVREARGVEGPLALAARPQVWDGRFVASGTGVTLDRLRPGAMALMRAALPESALRRVPAPARPMVPALYDDGGLLAVPSFGFRRAGAQMPEVTVDFLPRCGTLGNARPR